MRAPSPAGFCLVSVAMISWCAEAGYVSRAVGARAGSTPGPSEIPIPSSPHISSHYFGQDQTLPQFRPQIAAPRSIPAEDLRQGGPIAAPSAWPQVHMPHALLYHRPPCAQEARGARVRQGVAPIGIPHESSQTSRLAHGSATKLHLHAGGHGHIGNDPLRGVQTAVPPRLAQDRCDPPAGDHQFAGALFARLRMELTLFSLRASGTHLTEKHLGTPFTPRSRRPLGRGPAAEFKPA